LPLGPKKKGSVQLIQRIFVPKLPDFEEKKSEIAIFRQYVPAGHQNMAGFLKKFLLSSLI
jgi:hypothetical protein